MKIFSNFRLVTSVLLLIFFCVSFAPLRMLAQTASAEAEVLPKKSDSSPDQGSSEKSDSSTGDSSGALSGKPGSAEDLSSFSISVIVFSMLLGGLLLLFVEVALIPGFGVTGVTGIIVIICGVGIGFWKLPLHIAVIYTIFSIIALIGAVFWAIYVFPHTSTGKRFVLETRISVEDGYTTTLDLQKYVGMQGVATSDLRPSGIARIGDERLDVVSDGDFIPRGSQIKVIQAKQTNLVVGLLPASEQPPATV